MNREPTDNDPAESLSRKLEQARLQKTFSQLPSLRRLNHVCRGFALYFGVFQLPYMVFSCGHSVHDVITAASTTSLSTFQMALLWTWVALMITGISLVMCFVLLCLRYSWRLRRHEFSRLRPTMRLMPTTYLAKTLVYLPLATLPLFVFSGAGLALKHDVIAIVAGGFAVEIIFYLGIRHCVRTGLAELPALIDESSRGPFTEKYDYWGVGRQFGICTGVAALVLGASYFLVPAKVHPEGANAPLNESHAAPPVEGVAWSWPTPENWVPQKIPGTNFAACFSRPGRSDQIFFGVIVEHGTTLQITQAAELVRLQLSRDRGDFQLLEKTSVSSTGLSWEQFEFTTTFGKVPLHYVYRVNTSRRGSYTLLGWSLADEFDEQRSHILQAFDTFIVR